MFLFMSFLSIAYFMAAIATFFGSPFVFLLEISFFALLTASSKNCSNRTISPRRVAIFVVPFSVWSRTKE